MRIDKFLKVSRILKRRVVAKELADHNRIFLNGRQVKAGQQVAIGDIVKLVFGNRSLTIKVLALTPQVKKDEAEMLYEVISEEN